MTRTDEAARELAMWQEALLEQRAAEQELDQARQGRRTRRMLELIPQVQALRTRCDLLLAEAVRLQCALRQENARTAGGRKAKTAGAQGER